MIVLSCAIGWVIGRILLCLMAFKRIPMKYLILPLGLGIFVFCHWFTDYSIANYPVSARCVLDEVMHAWTSRVDFPQSRLLRRASSLC